MDPAATLQPPHPPPPTTTAAVFPAADKVTGEAPNNHIAHAANPSPAATAQSFNHPPYADMIYGAITALKERNGSSKRAIAKYIESAYRDLPPAHSALLTHHLKRMKSNGLLVMVKKSYMLPGSRSDSTNHNIDTTSTNATTNTTSTTTNLVPPPHQPTEPVSSTKRGRGRPPKPKSIYSPHQPIDQPSNNNAQPIMVPVGLSFTTPFQSTVGPASAPITANVAGQPNFPAVAEGKRGRGRPKKLVVGGQGVALVVGAATRKGRPSKSRSKKSPGRPRKPKSVAANGLKKRLPKSVVVPYATGAANVPRPRGRPKKAAAVLAGGAAAVVPAKRPGRPPKLVGGVIMPKKSPGRPKKNANSLWAVTDASQAQAEAYGDLKRKFEFFQSKVKQAVGVLKPQFTHETPISAVAAIQELEGLASMDINTPLREEPQPQPQPQPLPTQN